MQHSVSAADGLCETLLIQSFELVRRASFSRRAVDMLFSPARALPMFFACFCICAFKMYALEFFD